MFEKYLALLEELRLLGEKIPAMIAEMPDNPRIERTGNGNCFIMSSAHIGKNMSAEHHDFKYQYREVVKYLQADTPLNHIEKIKRILDTKRIPNHINRFFTLHDDVLEHIRKSLMENGLKLNPGNQSQFKIQHPMQTNLNRTITSIKDAKAYLRELEGNGEAYHPDDSADLIIWDGIAPDTNECIKLDSLMDACRDFLDPCEELLALEHKDKTYEVEAANSSADGVSGYVLYLSDITGEDFGEYLNVGKVGDKFENGKIKITRTK